MFCSRPNIFTDNYEESSLYMTVWPTSLAHPSLSILGYFSILGSVGPVVELQARWAAGVFCGSLKLPSKTVMLSEVKETKSSIFKRLGQYKIKVSIPKGNLIFLKASTVNKLPT